MKIQISGVAIDSECAFHADLASQLDLPPAYGRDLNALAEILSTSIQRPMLLVWKHSSTSRQSIGERFDQIVAVMRTIERQDREWGLTQTFELRLD